MLVLSSYLRSFSQLSCTNFVTLSLTLVVSSCVFFCLLLLLQLLSVSCPRCRLRTYLPPTTCDCATAMSAPASNPKSPLHTASEEQFEGTAAQFLFYLCATGRLEPMRRLVQERPDVLKARRGDMSVLQVAITLEQQAIVEYLVNETDIDIYYKSPDGYDAIAGAAALKRVAALRCLLKRPGIDVSRSVVGKRPLIFEALQPSQLPSLPSNDISADFASSLASAEDHKAEYECLKLLVEEGGCDINATDPKGYTALTLCTLTDNALAALYILRKGDSQKQFHTPHPCGDEFGAIFMAVAGGARQVMRAIVAHVACYPDVVRPHIQDDTGVASTHQLLVSFWMAFTLNAFSNQQIGIAEDLVREVRRGENIPPITGDAYLDFFGPFVMSASAESVEMVLKHIFDELPVQKQAEYGLRLLRIAVAREHHTVAAVLHPWLQRVLKRAKAERRSAAAAAAAGAAPQPAAPATRQEESITDGDDCKSSCDGCCHNHVTVRVVYSPPTSCCARCSSSSACSAPPRRRTPAEAAEVLAAAIRRDAAASIAAANTTTQEAAAAEQPPARDEEPEWPQDSKPDPWHAMRNYRRRHHKD